MNKQAFDVTNINKNKRLNKSILAGNKLRISDKAIDTFKYLGIEKVY